MREEEREKIDIRDGREEMMENRRERGGMFREERVRNET